MLSPVVIPLPLAAAAIALLAYAAVVLRGWLAAADALAVAVAVPPAPVVLPGRHRIRAADGQYRPRGWAELSAALTAERTARYHQAALMPGAELHLLVEAPLHRELLTEVERATALAVTEDTDELLAVA